MTGAGCQDAADRYSLCPMGGQGIGTGQLPATGKRCQNLEDKRVVPRESAEHRRIVEFAGETTDQDQGVHLDRFLRHHRVSGSVGFIDSPHMLFNFRDQEPDPPTAGSTPTSTGRSVKKISLR